MASDTWHWQQTASVTWLMCICVVQVTRGTDSRLQVSHGWCAFVWCRYAVSDTWHWQQTASVTWLMCICVVQIRSRTWHWQQTASVTWLMCICVVQIRSRTCSIFTVEWRRRRWRTFRLYTTTTVSGDYVSQSMIRITLNIYSQSAFTSEHNQT